MGQEWATHGRRRRDHGRMVSPSLLFWSGVGFEVAGLALVGASDYVPLARDLWHGARRRTFSSWLRRRLGLRQDVVVRAEAGASTAFGGHARGVVSPSDDATLEEKVAFLLRQLEQTDEQLDNLAGTVADLPASWRRDIAALRGELEQRIERRLNETQERYLTLRRIGLVCLLVGVALVSASNL